MLIRCSIIPTSHISHKKGVFCIIELKRAFSQSEISLSKYFLFHSHQPKQIIDRSLQLVLICRQLQQFQVIMCVLLVCFCFIVFSSCICGKDKEEDGSQQWFFLRWRCTNFLLHLKQANLFPSLFLNLILVMALPCRTSFLLNQLISPHTNTYLIQKKAWYW